MQQTDGRVVSTHRVIFPDPDIWTTPKEQHTMNVNPNNAGDLRRAAAFIKHHAATNQEGMNAVLQEALGVKRATQFIEGILATYDAIVPQMCTPAGQRGMAELILGIAEGDHLDAVPDHWQRAARFLVAYGNQRNDEMQQIMHETDNVSPTIIGICDVYTVVLPSLHTPFGMQIIDSGIRALMAKEVEGDQ